MASRDEVMAALAKVPGPDGRTPLPESGAISGLTIRDGKVFLAIVVDPDRAKALEPMRARAEAAIRAAARVVQRGRDPDRRGGPRRRRTRPRSRARAWRRRAAPAGHGGRSSAPIPGVKHIIAVASGKGGVGKSTVACNLAVGLAKLGLKVGVLDADLFGPSMPKLFGLTAKPDLAPDGQMLVPLEAYGVKVMSIGFLIEEGAPVIWRGPMVMSALTQLLREVDWGALDVLVVDMPPGTGDTQLTMAQNVPLSGRGDRLDATGSRADRRQARHRDVQAGPRAADRHRREHELFPLPALRRADRRLLARRRATGGREARRSVPRRGAARHRHPRQFRRRARPSWRACPTALMPALSSRSRGAWRRRSRSGRPGAKPAPRIRVI